MQLNLTGFGVNNFSVFVVCQRPLLYNKTRVSLILDYYNLPPITFKPRIVEKQLEINKVRLVMANRRLFGAVNSKCLNDSFSSI